ncbi:hypothetical protein SAMN04489712_101272 [Thermomonospora echinospora]|uniref:Uncharacterized protein n=1 Tax=Thermomonospora echinospora TaxID=1992 RepID=A0A1H5SME2_9ACTN|nr:hypothetical protein [Thermomonospora echinospora]SEF51610.1 hypothetical protein SAMN04489712_101272 [Thermomonospora echinospora]
MIILSGVLVVVAIGLLVAGIVAGDEAGAQVLGVDALMMIYISIAVSIVSALCLIVGVFLRRRELLFGTGASPARTARAKGRKGRKKAGRKPGRQTPAPATARAADTAPVATGAAQPARVPDEALVHVIPGRKRYHLASCRQVAGRGTEELTYVEAREEGFSPCTACMPDTVLAARAASAAQSAEHDAKSAEDAKGTKGAKGSKTTKGSRTAQAAADSEAERQDGTAEQERGPGKDAGSGTTAVLTKPDVPTDSATRPGPGESAPTAPAPAAPSTVPSAWSPPASSQDGSRDTAARSTAKPTVAEQAASEPASDIAGDAQTAPAPSAGSDPQVRILSGTKRFHRSDCALIEDIGDETEELQALPLSEARARGCTPCLVCQPDKAHARD